MAELLVSIVIEQLGSILHQQVEAGVQLVKEVEGEVKNLTDTFEVLAATLKDADCVEVKEHSARHWLDSLKDTSYDIDDVLDEWSTMIQKSQIVTPERASGLVTKVCSQISYHSFCYRKAFISYDTSSKIRVLDKKLDSIAKKKDSFNFNLMKGTGKLEQQISTSVIDIGGTHGRDHEKYRVKNLLLSENSDRSTSLPIISIVGMEGIGKTTLARLVFNDDEVKGHFKERIWVPVSNPFDEVRIAKSILESLIHGASDLVGYDPVLRRIQELVKDLKYLLVLDDAWTEDFSKWEQLLNSLKGGSRESRILVTTHKKNVAEVLGTTKSNLIELEMLSDEHCWKLFHQFSLSERCEEADYNELEDIGRKIVGKCQGLPLAVKSLGTYLQSKTIKEWNEVLGSELWNLEEVENSLFRPLLSSYYDLSPVLKKCFLYCAIFPKNYVMKKDQLVQLWMAQGYLRTKQGDDMELDGEKCFTGLVMRSFFQDFEPNKYDGGVMSCKMHHIMHDFVQFLAKDEFSTVELDSPKKSQSESTLKARHSMIIFRKGALFPTPIHNELRKLRSALIVNRSLLEIDRYLPSLFDQMLCLRSLDLSFTLLEVLPRGLGKLIHLRYLNLSSNDKLKKLPETLCHLCNLQTLNLSNCWRLETLPEEIGRLLKLRHLINYGTGTKEFIYMPKGFERLTSLRTLNKIVIVGGDVKACNFECLGNLNHLEGFLDIECRGPVDVGEINKAGFTNKKKLFGLRIEFCDAFHLENFEIFKPPPNLENLKIERYKGNAMPLKMDSLTKLKELHLQDWENLECLPPLGKLQSLRTLTISYLSSVKIVDNKFLGTKSDGSSSSSSTTVFPNLQFLELSYMSNWEKWDYGTISGKIKIMPRLRYLAIIFCKKLTSLPNNLSQLEMLEELKICSCPQLNTVTDEVFEPPPNLSKLEIESYNGSPMSFDRITSLTKLRILRLEDCKNFDCLPPLGKLSCLESLSIRKMRNVRRVGNDFLGTKRDGMSSFVAFPQLQSLEVRDMESWTDWDYGTTSRGKENITIMPRLSSLSIRNCRKLKTVPEYLMQLTTLKKFDAEDCGLVGRYRWEIVKALVKKRTDPEIWIYNNLIDLSIDLKGVDSEECAEAFPPPTKEDANGVDSIRSGDAFQPPPKIENLKIEYGNFSTPHWMVSLTTLKELWLENCMCLPTMGNLLFLERLHIIGLTVKDVGGEFLVESKPVSSSLSMIVFPQLQCLEFKDMKNWEEWNFTSGREIKIMPCLRSLIIQNCPRLKTLPNYLLQLTTLEECNISEECSGLKDHYIKKTLDDQFRNLFISETRKYLNPTF